jgi:hypothetical protein
VSGNHTLRVKSHSASKNRTLRVKINLVRVVITFVPFEITMRVEIRLELAEITLGSVIFPRIRVKLTLVCVESILCV